MKRKRAIISLGIGNKMFKREEKKWRHRIERNSVQLFRIVKSAMHGKRSPSRLQNAVARNLRCNCISKSSNARNRGVVRKWSTDTSFSIRKWWVNSCGILELETSTNLSPKSCFLQFPNKVIIALELILVCHGCHGNISFQTFVQNMLLDNGNVWNCFKFAEFRGREWIRKRHLLPSLGFKLIYRNGECAIAINVTYFVIKQDHKL